ncbi:MAG: hypothetical protein JNK17_08100 [Hydrogenophaga sp.]|nr:hypothetical protein [Hydrogenophaga sp.]
MHPTFPFTLPFVTRHDLRALLLTLMFVAALLLGMAPSARAQGTEVRATSTDQVKFPAGLKWERMRDAATNFVPADPKTPVVKFLPSDLATVNVVWHDLISASTEKAPIFNMLIANTSLRGRSIVFSQVDLLDFSRCEPPANGRSVVDVYSKCLARVAIGGKDKSAPAQIREFDNFCFVMSPWETKEEQQFRALNQVQFSFDPATATAYFRLLQHGAPVPACNRAIKLEGL